ncbi:MULTISPECIES: DUF6566 family protein [Caballeronia]|jgi:hypothetical protein|uniref:DUF6566 family protein n=1 Tax=Caballeronia TaxID=1827195 RepID=UPI00158D3F42|nr:MULTISPECIES: DUF6566 family protein [Caballeronia]MCG7404671.1 hypothetical protein [Caballeronia zhejiangensis]MCI1044097.1 hypothetical protein [Caballeronia zhejiangensis]
MKTETFSLGGYDVEVSTKQTPTGDWTPELRVTRNGRPVALPQVETVEPNWLTSAEALRGGVEQARRLIDRYLAGHDNQHTGGAIGHPAKPGVQDK